MSVILELYLVWVVVPSAGTEGPEASEALANRRSVPVELVSVESFRFMVERAIAPRSAAHGGRLARGPTHWKVRRHGAASGTPTGSPGAG